MISGWGWRSRLRTGVQVELDVCIFLALVAVVVRAALDDLHVAQRYGGRRGLRRDEAAERNHRRDGEGDGRKEAEHILQPHEC
jgi:hypothetical protein